jgi:hypothetical protein
VTDVYQASAETWEFRIDGKNLKLHSGRGVNAPNQPNEYRKSLVKKSPSYAKSRYKPTENEPLSPLKTEPLYQNEERTVLASTLVLEPLKMELHTPSCV